MKLGLAFLLSFVLAVWSANGGMKAIIDALDVVYEDEKRGFKFNAISLAFTFGGLAVVLLAIGAVVALPIVLATIGLGALTDARVRIGRWPVLVMTMLVGLALSTGSPQPPLGAVGHQLSVGSVFATLTWLAGSALYRCISAIMRITTRPTAHSASR